MNRDGRTPARDEQHGGFNCGYRMTCGCGGASYLSAMEYHVRSTRDALMPCEQCDRTIHFGPAVAALRNPSDAALDNARITKLAWYHTSAQSDWPSASFAEEHRASMLASARHIPPERINAFVEKQLNQALHVGTYEAAIENMLRRMYDQGDAALQFYLHRVTLAVDPDRVNDGYRDENHESAAQLTTEDLRNDGLVAVRYLNVYEAVGSLSLAVLPETIACVQTIRLPVTAIHPARNSDLLKHLDEVQRLLDELRASAPDTSAVTPVQLRMMQLTRRDPEGLGAARAAYDRRYYQLWKSAASELAKQHLVEISPVVRDRFEHAMSAWSSKAVPTVHQFSEFFSASAVALTQSSSVRSLVAAQKPRAMTTVSSHQQPRWSSSDR